MVGFADGCCKIFQKLAHTYNLSVLWHELRSRPGHPSEIRKPRYTSEHNVQFRRIILRYDIDNREDTRKSELV